MKNTRIALLTTESIDKNRLFPWRLSSTVSAVYGILAMSIEKRGEDAEIKPFPDSVVDLAKPASIEKFLRTLEKFDPSMFAVSCTSSSYSELCNLSPILRERFGDTPILAGGVHFTNEKVYSKRLGRQVMSSTEKCLHDRLADGVVVGSIAPLLDIDLGKLATWLKTRSDSFDMPAGVYYRQGNSFTGKPNKKRTVLDFPPLSLEFVNMAENSPPESYLRVLLKNSCGNGCDYCSIPSTSIDISAKDAADCVASHVAGLLKHEVTINMIRLSCSNPMQERYQEYYTDFFKALREQGIDIPAAVMLEPELLTQKVTHDFALYCFKQGYITQFAVGKETFDADIAKKIGRKNCGEVPDQQDLDDQHRALVMFIKEMASIGGREYTLPDGKKAATVPEIRMFNMVTPFDTPSSVDRMLSGLDEYVSASDGKVKPAFGFFALQPFPGTIVRRKYIDMIKDPEDYRLRFESNPWDCSHNPFAGRVIDYLATDYKVNIVHKDHHAVLAGIRKEIQGLMD